MNQTIATIINDRKYHLHAAIGRHPALYYKIYTRRYPFSEMAMRKDRHICIEGFPRSANSYAVVAFKLDNSGIKPGHHLHVPAQIIRACQLNKPVITVIREPQDAVASFLIFQSSTNAALYLKLYIDFYKALIQYKKQIIIADFKTVTTDFNSVIKRVNRKYGTQFNEIKNLDQRQDKIFDRLKEINQQFFGGRLQNSMIPDEQREKTKEQVKQLVLKSPLLETAQQIYHSFTEESGA